MRNKEKIDYKQAKKMKIYLISQDVNCDYDTYDSAVVCAENEEYAKRIHPSDTWENGGYYDEEKKEFWTLNIKGIPYLYEDNYGTWTNDLSKIKVKYLGEADESLKSGVICSSFNAG